MSYRREGDQRRFSERHFRSHAQPPGTYPARRGAAGFGWARSGDVLDQPSQERAPSVPHAQYDRTGQEGYARGLRRFESEDIDEADRDIGFADAAERWEFDDGGVQFGPSRSYAGAAAPGPFAGRGPRGYERADVRIREDVCDCLTEDGDLDATDIEVTVEHGIVTLTGTVARRAAKRRAEDIAGSIRGVKDVQNQLRISAPAEPRDS